MVAAACLNEVKAAAKGLLSDEDVGNLIEELHRRRASRAAGDLNGLDDALLEEASDMAKTLAEAAMIEKRNQYLNILAKRRISSFLAKFNDPAEGMVAYTVGVNNPVPGARLSIDARSKAIAHEYVGGILADLRKADLIDQLNSRDLDLDIAREMWELDKPNAQTGLTGNKPAQQIAEIFHKYQRAAVGRQNRAGAWIKPLPGYIVRQTHDPARLRRAGFEAWRDAVLPRLDLEATLGGANADEFLRAAYTNIVSGRHGQTRGAEGAGDRFFAFKGPANLAKKVSSERVLHFKSAEDWHAYNEKFGHMNLAEGVIHGLERQARNIALMEGLGTNPRAMFDKVMDELKDMHKGDPAVLDKLNKQSFRWYMDELDGTSNIPGSVTWARYGSSWRAIESMSKLGGATLSSFNDIATQAAELRYQGVGLLESYGNAFQNVLGRVSGKEQKILGELIGEGFDGMLGAVLSRFSATDHLPGRMSKLQNQFFRLSLMNWWTDSHKRGVTLMMSRHLAMNRHLPMSQLPENLQRVLSLYLEPKQWDALRTRAVRVSENGKEYLTPDAVRDMTDAEVQRIMGKDKATARDIRRYRDDLETAVRAYFTDRADYSIPTPGAKERAWMKAGTQPGTPEGEAMRFFSQFKAFPITYVSKALGREVHGYGGRASMRGLAHLMVASTVMGYLAMTAKDISKGRNPRDPTDAKTWGAAFVQGGGAGIYGDFLMGEANRFGQGALDTFMGPTFGSTSSLMDIMYRWRSGDDAAAKSFKFAINHTPFINLFYTRAALDYMVLYEVQEMMNPGYLRRMEKRIEKENNQTFMISPSAAAR
ncbi:hypothetical protein [Primorskyibacter sedentarius]|uniref:hypothetical protein n=1 Tax=Primorskyibacter sedentarius TaxID=745311 RepID=UPI003EBFA4D1